MSILSMIDRLVQWAERMYTLQAETLERLVAVAEAQMATAYRAEAVANSTWLLLERLLDVQEQTLDVLISIDSRLAVLEAVMGSHIYPMGP